MREEVRRNCDRTPFFRCRRWSPPPRIDLRRRRPEVVPTVGSCAAAARVAPESSRGDDARAGRVCAQKTREKRRFLLGFSSEFQSPVAGIIKSSGCSNTRCTRPSKIDESSHQAARLQHTIDHRQSIHQADFARSDPTDREVGHAVPGAGGCAECSRSGGGLRRP